MGQWSVKGSLGRKGGLEEGDSFDLKRLARSELDPFYGMDERSQSVLGSDSADRQMRMERSLFFRKPQSQTDTFNQIGQMGDRLFAFVHPHPDDTGIPGVGECSDSMESELKGSLRAKEWA